MSTKRSDTLDEALNELMEMELDEVDGASARPPPIPGMPPKTPAMPPKTPAMPPKTPAMPPRTPATPLKIQTDPTPGVSDDDTARTQLQQALPPLDLTNDTHALIRTCMTELEQDPSPQRAARLHCEIAHAYEENLRDPGSAVKHYEKALSELPENLPAIRGARRVYLAAGEYKRALPLFEVEARLSPDARTKALLHYERARLLEGFTGRVAEAKKTYATALALDPSNLSIIEAVKRTAMRTGDWQGVSDALEQAANAVTGDDRLRAAIMMERAKIAESQFDDSDAAIELAESALRIDGNALGALEQLERLYHARREWRPLVAVLERQAARTTDERVRALAFHEIGRLHGERLQNRTEALDSLQRAAQATENRDRLILEDLVHLHERNHEYQQLSGVLRTLLETVATDDEQVALLHKLGSLHERQLHDEEHAVHYYQAALSLEPTHQPTLQALAGLYTRQSAWEPLIVMHQAEADAINDSVRRAAAHGRIAEILESHLERPIDAMVHYERALSLDATHNHSFRALNRLYAKSGRYRELAEHYERALDNAPSRDYKLTYLYKIGSLWEDTLNDPVQAAYAYRRLLRIDPQNLGAIHALQRVTEQAGQYHELVEALDLEVRESKEPALEVALLHRAGMVLDEKLNDRDGALVRFNRVLELDPQYAPVLVSLGRLFYREGRWEELLGVYEKQLVTSAGEHESAVMLFKMGELCEHRLARQEDAVGYYRQATERAPGYRPAVHALARLVRQREQWSDLIDALELQLINADAPHTRAMLLFTAGQIHEERLEQPERAIERYESALIEDPNYWPVIAALARLRAAQSAWKPLLEDLEREGHATMDALVSGAALMRQGDILVHNLHDPQSAIVHFEALVDSPPGKLPALLALEFLYAKTEAWAALAAVYEAEAETITDANARVAALRELLNVQQVKAVGGARELTSTYKYIAGMAPDDLLALDSLHQLACTNDDPATLAEVCRSLARNADDAALAARYLSSLGQALERLGAPGAMDAYRAAVDKDPDSLSAVRGLARTARAHGDHETEARAARMEAASIRAPRAIADLLFHSAELRLDRLGDPDGAAEDLERALDAWPDHHQAAERLKEPLVNSGQTERLLTILSRSAGRAPTAKIAARHWLEVANLHLEHLGDVGSGVAALQRALKLDPTHVSSLRKLAEVYILDRRLDEAIELYKRVADVSANRKVLCQTHLQLAELYGSHRKDADAALEHYAAVLDIDPHHRDALVQLTEFHLQRGDGDAAVATARRMINAAPDTESRTWALLQLASIEIRRNAPERAENALIEALALEGPGGEAASAFRALVESRGSWIGYIAGLTGYVQRGATDRNKLVQTYMELAQVYGDHMAQPAQAVKRLEEALVLTGPQPELTFELSRRLCEAGRYNEGLAQLQALVQADVTHTEAWRALAQTLEKLKQPREALHTLAPLVILQTADSRERSHWYTRKPRPAEAPANALGPEILPRLAADNVMASPATEIIAALAEGLGRLYRPDLESLGISRRDRIASRSRHPMRLLADHIAAIFGVEYDLYLHPRTTPAASIEMTEPVSIVVAEHVAELPIGQQTFLLAMCMASIAGRFFPVEKLSRRELSMILAAATSLVVPGFGAELPEDEMALHTQRLKKVVSRKWRRNLEIAAAEYAVRPLVDLAPWQRALRFTAMRAGLLVADDPLGVVEVLREEEELLELRGAELLRRSTAIADLVRFWASPNVLTLRRDLGLPQ